MCICPQFSSTWPRGETARPISMKFDKHDRRRLYNSSALDQIGHRRLRSLATDENTHADAKKVAEFRSVTSLMSCAQNTFLRFFISGINFYTAALRNYLKIVRVWCSAAVDFRRCKPDWTGCCRGRSVSKIDFGVRNIFPSALCGCHQYASPL